MRQPRTCLHCGNGFTQVHSVGRNRQWCYDCLPAKGSTSPEHYIERTRGLAAFKASGIHSTCCGVCRDCARPYEPWCEWKRPGAADARCHQCYLAYTRNRQTPHRASLYTVVPSRCLYCDDPPCTARSCACATHSDHHRWVMAKVYRDTDAFRAKRNEAKNKRRAWKNLRLLTVIRLIERDGLRCAVCGFPISIDADDPIEIDHAIPVSRGGANDLTNLQLTHGSCNRTKASRISA